MDIKQKIHEVRGDTAILAHTYQDYDIVELADVTGDSYALAKAATKLPNKRIVVCGVRFMAETVKILNPEKEVVLANPKAGCPMADNVDIDKLKKLINEMPDVPVVAYVNTTVETKALSTVCVTSSTAVKIVKAIPGNAVIFLPDANLGRWVRKMVPEKNFIIWDGCCPVHNSVLVTEAKRAKRRHQNSVLAVHPECDPEISEIADFVGATSQIIDYVMETDDKAVTIGTESSVYKYIKRKCPEKEIYQLCENKLVCKDMRITTLNDVCAALEGTGGEVIEIDENLRLKAKNCLDKMLEYGG